MIHETVTNILDSGARQRVDTYYTRGRDAVDSLKAMARGTKIRVKVQRAKGHPGYEWHATVTWPARKILRSEAA